MKKYAIEYKLKPSYAPVFWAWRQGTKAEARASAIGLRRSLRDYCGYSKAVVYVNGVRITA